MNRGHENSERFDKYGICQAQDTDPGRSKNGGHGERSLIIETFSEFIPNPNPESLDLPQMGSREDGNWRGPIWDERGIYYR